MAGVVAPRLRVGLHVSQLIHAIPGGIGRVTQLLCDELPKYVDVVPFAVGSRHDRAGLATRLAPAIELHRVLGLPSIRWQYELWHHLRRPRVHLNIDVCHAPSLALPPTNAALVVSVNDVAFLRHPETFPTHGLRFHTRGLATARREAAAIIVPSEFTRDELVREGFERGRIHCVPLALQPVPQQPSTRRPDVLSMIGVQTPYLLSAGTLEPRKDHATLLAAFERSRIRQPTLSLVIAGPTGWLPDEGMYAKPGVIRLGHIPNSYLDVLYREAAIVVAPSIYEGFDLVVLEAMARGRPVIASRIPPHVELAGNAARFFPPRDVDSLAQHIDELLGDPDARDELGRAAALRSERFTVDITIAGHLAAYQRAAGVPRHTASR